jgi:hypothetical protein
MRYLVLVALTACATDTSKLEARVHDLEKEVAGMRAPDAQACAVTHDVTIPPATMFDAPVPVEIGETHLHDGDSLVIKEVRGTSPSLAINGMYEVRGEYTLASADEAEISFTVRARNKGEGCTNGTGHHLWVKRGSGTFQVSTRIAYDGDPSISFFRRHDSGPTTREHEIGTVYFENPKGAHGNIDSIASKAMARAQCKPIDISFPDTTKFPEVVPFDVGRTDVRSGDKITIREVRGTRKDFAIDGIYQVRGDYTLASADEAVIGLNVTGGCTSHTERGHVTVKKGSGTFEVAVKIAYVGQPHVTFYVNGEGSGGVYFGKGDFLLK